MSIIQQILTSITALVMTLSAQMGNLTQSINSQSQLAQVAPTSGLVGYWKFDEGSGTTANDSSGSRTGTLSGGPTWATGKINNALNFDGNDDQVTAGSLGSGFFSSPSTISVWLKSGVASGDWRGAVTQGDNDAGFWWLGFYNGAWQFYGNGAAQELRSSAISANTWYHVAIVQTSSSLLMYVNGVQVASTVNSTVGNNGTLNIGRTGGYSEFFQGSIDEVRAYNRTLSAQEILDIYNDTGTPPPPDTTPPTLSSVLASGITQTGATINWTTNENSDTQVEYGLTTSYGQSTTLNTSLLTSHVAVIAGLNANTTYNYRVKSKDASGNLSTSNNQTFTTLAVSAPDSTPPSVPSGLSATAVSSSQINLSWSASTDNIGVTGYDIYRNSSLLTSVTGTSYSNTGLTASTQYSYTVRSKDAAGNTSSQSSSVSATTQASTPPTGNRVDRLNSSGTLLNTYTTIQACATAMAAGDTCKVYAGTYNEHVTVPAGSIGNYKTVTINGSDVVNVLSFFMNSYTKVNGFRIQNPSAPTSRACVGIANGATSVYITNNTISQCGDGTSDGGSMVTSTNTGGASYVYIQGNNLSWGCGTPSAPDACYGIYLIGHHFLIENNDISHTQLGINLGATHTVVRNNIIRDMDVAECRSKPGCHMDFIFTEPGSATPTRYNLWEANVTRNGIGGDSKGFLTQADVCGGNCYNVIIRFNEIAHIGSGGLTNDNAFNTSVPGFSYVKSYNNSWVNTNITNSLYAGTIFTSNGSNYGSAINDIFYYPQAMVSFNPYATDNGTAPTFSSNNNLAYCTSSTCNLKGRIYDRGVFTEDPGNIIANPQFVNYSSNDFRLQSSSPAINAGGKLTTVASADTGSGTTLRLNDASYFQDGYGLAGVQPDCIAIGSTTNTACISSINYSTNTITLSSSISRSSGQNVYLYKDSDGTQVLYGSAPDIGAHEYTGSTPSDTTAPSTPTNLTATAVSSSQINLSWNASTDAVGVTGYRVERCSGASCSSFSQVATPSSNSYSDTSLTANTSYSYRVRATDAAGNLSSYSTTASATTQSGSTPPSTKFTAGQRVQTTSNLNVRATASATGTLLGTQPTGSLGTIISGGQSADGFYWWNVNFDNAPDGYSVEDYLQVVPTGGNRVDLLNSSGSVVSTHTTIQACATAMSGGQTCKVFAGTYNENVTVPAGSSGNFKTLQVNGSDLVYVQSFTLNSYTKVIGFRIQNPSSPASRNCIDIASNATNVYITNNNFYACGNQAMIREPSTGSATNYVFIQGNTFSYSCSTSSSPNTCTLAHLNGNYHLVENNDISHVSDGFYVSGSYNVLRNNIFHDVRESECGSNSGNCHIDFMQADATYPAGLPSRYLVIEENTIKDQFGGNTHGMGLFQGQSCGGQCYNAIVRLNLGAHIGSGAILNDNSGAPPPAWINVKGYNNSWVDLNNVNFGVGEGTNGFDHGSSGGAQINELFYYPRSLSDFNPYECQGGTNPDACATFAYRNNLAYCTGSTCNLRSHLYGVGSFLSDPGNKMVDPQFVSYASNNFNLQSTSPAINAGSHLTTVANADSSSGTSLIVADAGYFQDGYTLSGAGVQPDWIRIGPSTTVQISSINYSTNTITLANAVSRNDGDPVYLYKDSNGTQVLYGSLPDIGAFEYTGSTPSDTTPPSTPTSLSATAVSSSGINLSWTASTDVVGVTGYKIYRAGTQIGTSATNSYSDSGLSASTAYSYTVSAYDAANNNSSQSSSASATTQAATGGSRTFYIDFTSGVDSNNGTAKATPWKRAPGMTGFTGSYTHQAGDTFIFKGGVTWNSSALPLTINYSGSSGSTDSYTTDRTWYSGSSWSQPVFDGGGVASTGITAYGKSYITVNDIKIVNIGVPRVSNSKKAVDFADSHHITFSNMTIAGDTWLGFYIYLASSGTRDTIKIINNDISSTAQGIVVATAAANAIYNDIDIGYNTIHDFTSQIGGGVHGDGIHTWGQTTDSTQYITNMRIHDNLFYGDFSRSFGIDGAMTALIYVSDATEGTQIYNNVGSFTNKSNSTGNLFEAMISLRANAGRGGYHQIYNNTFLGTSNNDMSAAVSMGDGSGNDPVGTTIKNNIFSGMRYVYYIPYGQNLTINNNVSYSTNDTAYYTDGFKTWAQWRALGFDTNGSNSNPLFVSSTDLRLQSTSPAINTGVVGISSVDKNGVARPQGSAWDMGAYEYTGVVTPPPSTKFTVGQRVQAVPGVGSNLNVRATASATGTLLGTQPNLALGTVVSGGQSVDSYFWWNVNFDTGVDGYAVENYLQAYSAPIVGDFNSDGLVNSLDLSLLTGAWNTSNVTYDLNHDGIVNSLDYAILSSNWSL